jgi:hypothetical protein
MAAWFGWFCCSGLAIILIANNPIATRPRALFKGEKTKSLLAIK